MPFGRTLRWIYASRTGVPTIWTASDRAGNPVSTGAAGVRGINDLRCPNAGSFRNLDSSAFSTCSGFLTRLASLDPAPNPLPGAAFEKLCGIRMASCGGLAILPRPQTATSHRLSRLTRKTLTNQLNTTAPILVLLMWIANVRLERWPVIPEASQ
jgi:hypothetical protein